MKRPLEPDAGAASAAHWSIRSSQIREKVEELVRELFKDVTDVAHDMTHVLKVTRTTDLAIEDAGLEERQRLSLVLAALLHEADDYKLFKTHADANARRILAEVLSEEEAKDLTGLVVELINLVSTSKNKNSEVPAGEEWKLIVRDADRLEAIGEVGIARCYAFNKKKGDPYFLVSTPRPSTEEELWRVASPQRFAAYAGDSASMIDHYYDKLLHLDKSGSGNAYIQKQLDAQLQVMVEFVLSFGRSGSVDTARLDAMVQQYCRK